MKMLRLPFWVVPVVVVMIGWSLIHGVGGVTFQWSCKNLAAKQAAANIRDGYRPYDSYAFIGLGVGYCQPAYSTAPSSSGSGQ